MEGVDRDDIFLFAGFHLDLRGGGLFQCDGNGVLVPVQIGQRALDVLGVLVERAGELVTRDEIIAATWPETVVEDNNLNMQIAALRRVLDSGRTAPSSIQTIPRRGYRFVASVTRTRRVTQRAPAQQLQPSDPPPTDDLPDPKVQRRNPARQAVLAGAIGALLLAAVATAAWKVLPGWLFGGSSTPALSIVVLPFANLAGDAGQQYFADGITEDLTTDLSRFADMQVISRDTAFTYKDKPIKAKWIGRELGVHYVLEGSVQRFGSNVRINAQLIDTKTDTHLWADRFDRSVGDLLALQNEIATRIAVALNVKLIASQATQPNENPDALDHIFRGRAEMYKPASQSSFATAIAEYEQALALDPKSVEARGRLAIVLADRVLDHMSDTPRSDLEQADRLVEQALATTPDSPLAHFARGQLLRAQHHCETAIPEYETVLAANHNSLASIGNIGRCKIYLGSIDDGVALEEEVIQLSPHDPFLGVWYFRVGQARLLQSRTDEAIQWLGKAYNENSAFPFVHAWLAAAYGLKGDLPSAAAEVAKARRLSGNGAPISIAVERTGSARDFSAPVAQALLETTFLAGLRQAGVPEE